MGNEIIEKIKENKEKIKEKKVKKIGVFGSAIKDKENPSDIDILVKFEEVTADNFFGLLFLLENLFDKKVDLVDIDSLRKELEHVKEEAIYVEI